MSTRQTHTVTGAFGYSGKYIAQRLIANGHTVNTLTHATASANPFGSVVKAHPFHWHQPEKLVESLRGTSVLYNTYWVRFNHKGFSHADAVRNSHALFAAAKEAGVERIVHVSITNPSLDSPLEYFSGKAEVEQALVDTGVSYAILRPTVLFGKEDILINNIAWALRHLPVMGVFGDGSYRLQPIYVDDLAQLAVEQGERRQNVIIDAIGPETYTYRALIEMIGRTIGCPRPILSIPPWLGYAVGWGIGKLMGDVFITRAEIAGLMAELLYVEAPPAAETRLSDWVQQHAGTLGHRYSSELARRQTHSHPQRSR
ncbi:MAG: NAD(P)H-binding protein [Chloroflexi bacterium]|nr:NAD(P)H-binding protein [Chloroflexota bacterium]